MAKTAVKTESKKGRRQIRVVSFVIVFALAFTVVQCGRQLLRIDDLQAQRAEYQTAYEGVLDRQAELEETRELLNDDTYMERLAREHLLMVREGEYLVVPVEQNDDVVDYDAAAETH